MSGLKITQFTKEHDPAVAIAASAAASSTPLGGDLSGTPGSATVVAVGGISITGAPSGAGDEIIATSTTAAHWATPPASLSNPMTALDDLIVGGTVTGGVAAPARLGKGTDGQVLTVDPVTHHLYWATPGGGSLEVKEADGSPDVTGVTKIVLPNGSLTDNTGGQITIAFPGGGGVIVQDEGTPLTTTADTLNFAGAGVTATGSGTTKTITIPGGGGAVNFPDIIQYKQSTNTATSIVLDATPTAGHRLLLLSDATTGQISAMTCTNVVWTQLKTYTSAGASYYALWVGVVSAGASATITWTKPGAYCMVMVLEVADALTPTLGGNATGPANTPLRITGTTGHFVVGCGGCDNTTMTSAFNFLNVFTLGTGSNNTAISVAYVPASGVVSGQFGPSYGGAILAEVT